jgi:hypothetical protein
LKEARRFDVEGLLPKKGILLFFLCNEVYPAIPLVRHFDSPELVRCKVPEEPESSAFMYEELDYRLESNAYRVTLSNELTLPQLESSYVGRTRPKDPAPVKLDGDESERYEALLHGLKRWHMVCQMLGHPDQVQPFALESSLRDVQRKLFPGLKKLSYSDPYHRQSRLILQLSFRQDYPYYFGIREDDLRRGDFSRVWASQVRG